MFPFLMFIRNSCAAMVSHFCFSNSEEQVSVEKIPTLWKTYSEPFWMKFAYLHPREWEPPSLDMNVNCEMRRHTACYTNLWFYVIDDFDAPLKAHLCPLSKCSRSFPLLSTELFGTSDVWLQFQSVKKVICSICSMRETSCQVEPFSCDRWW